MGDMYIITKDSEFTGREHACTFEDERLDIEVECISLPTETVLRYVQVNRLVIPVRRGIPPEELAHYVGATTWVSRRGFRVFRQARLRVVCNAPFTCRLAVHAIAAAIQPELQRMRSVGGRR